MKRSQPFIRFVSCYSLFAVVFFGACSTPTQGIGEKVAEVALSSVGIKSGKAPAHSRTVNFRVDVAKDLNAGDDGIGLSTVMRVYKLRNHDSFLAAPYSEFSSPDKEKQALGADLIEARELTLTPGQKLVFDEKANGDTAYLGVVALFRSPSAQRWRFAFAVAEAERSGITIGVHACAMTATSMAPVGMDPNTATLLSSTRCK